VNGAGGTIDIPPPDLQLFFLLAVGLALLLAVAEVVAAFRDTTYDPWRALVSRWAFPLYGFYTLITLLLGLILFENGVLPRSYTGAVLLGLAGPAAFRTRIKLFQPISGAGGPVANLDKILTGLQTFCFDQIKRALARRRMTRKERAARHSEAALLERLRALYSPAELERLTPLIETRREREPESVRAFLVALIEERDPGALEQPFADSGTAGGDEEPGSGAADREAGKR
jgi:hypothetical protein